MCVTFVAIDHNPRARYKLIILNNRDENLDRATSVAAWEDGILAGRDEKDEKVRGSWLAMDETGRIANILSITIPPNEVKKNAKSRGAITIDFLRRTQPPQQFCDSLIDIADAYNGFQVLCLQRNENDQYQMSSLSSKLVDEMETLEWMPGVYGFGNSPAHIPFKKVKRGTELMKDIVREIRSRNMDEEEVISVLMQLATDRHQCFPDKQLQQQCRRSSAVCRHRTSLFVQFPDGIRYGTRSHSIILVDQSNRATFYEKSMKKAPISLSDAEWEERMFHFDLRR
ncbi:hypothetical protein AB6A40_002966 [Gnathostoma spinigerum]|uniref:Uncharacterized protein n=1 Tax=Gnathostoma spinigerum TaxID=75299 RepID=A0ABD6EAE4_9BILA